MLMGLAAGELDLSELVRALVDGSCMSENGSDSLPFEPPEQENIRLREENARLRRLLAAHSIPIPQFAPETPTPPLQAVETATPLNRGERARKRIALFRCLFHGREDVYARR